MVVATSTYVTDATLFVRDALASGVTDPISSSRGTDEKFVLTAYPNKPVRYPIITVITRNVLDDRHLGMSSESMLVRMRIEVRVWGRSAMERDALFQQSYNALRSIQLDSSTGSADNNLFNFMLLNAVPVDEQGLGGIHSMVAEYNYLAVIGG